MLEGEEEMVIIITFYKLKITVYSITSLQKDETTLFLYGTLFVKLEEKLPLSTVESSTTCLCPSDLLIHLLVSKLVPLQGSISCK